MRAEIVSVGTELLLGHIIDTNAAYLAQELTALGIDLFWVSQVGDNQARLVEVIRRAWNRSDLTIITGGVGPTEDDLTREAIAETLGEAMIVQPELEAELRAFFARRNRPMPERNVKQATLIPSASPLLNPIGTAPGWFVERDGRMLATMPGVPVEMYKMWSERVVPKLLGRQNAVIFTRIFKVLGIGESHVEEMIQELLASTNPTIATYAKNDGIHVRTTAKADSVDAAMALLRPMEAEVRRILGNVIYGIDDQTVEGVVGDSLRTAGLTLATMEGFTGGLISSAFVGAPVSDGYYRGGLTANGADQLAAWGVGPDVVGQSGLVSAATAAAMASAARRHFRADVGLALCGVPGPDHVEAQRPGTIHIAIDDRGNVVTDSGVGFGNTPTQIKGRASIAAADFLRKHLGAGG